MSKSRFDQAFAQFIRRGEEKITPKTFFDILAQTERRRVTRTVELRARVVDGRLEFEPSSELSVHDNQIVLGDQRIVVNVS